MLYGKQSGVFESRDLDEVFSFRVLDENVVIHAQGVILGQKVIVAKYRAAAVQADGNNEIDHDEFLMYTEKQNRSSSTTEEVYKGPEGSWPQDNALGTAGQINLAQWMMGLGGVAMWLLTRHGEPEPVGRWIWR
ncbi:hypothetical protein ACO22_06761, partial [Paracoccidioides brasiliensis]